MADSNVWPDGYRCAVVLTVDYNDIHGILTRRRKSPGATRRCQSGVTAHNGGVDRLLGLFEELGVRSSWFVPGIVAEENPEHIRAIQAGGHEIACAGYRHQNYDTSICSSKTPRSTVAAKRWKR